MGNLTMDIQTIENWKRAVSIGVSNSVNMLKYRRKYSEIFLKNI